MTKEKGTITMKNGNIMTMSAIRENSVRGFSPENIQMMPDDLAMMAMSDAEFRDVMHRPFATTGFHLTHKQILVNLIIPWFIGGFLVGAMFIFYAYDALIGLMEVVYDHRKQIGLGVVWVFFMLAAWAIGLLVWDATAHKLRVYKYRSEEE